MIEFKNPADKDDFEKLDPKLARVVDMMSQYARIVLGRTLTVTRIVERPTGDKKSDTHDQYPPYRFIDIRSKDIPDADVEKLRTIINLIFPYGRNSKGKFCETIPPIDHSSTSPNYTGEHFHVQVSSRKNFG